MRVDFVGAFFVAAVVISSVPLSQSKCRYGNCFCLQVLITIYTTHSLCC